MNRIRSTLSLVILAFAFIAACSRAEAETFDFDKAKTEVDRLTTSLFKSMSNGTEESAYQNLFDGKAKETFKAAALVTLSHKIISKLGALKSLDDGARSDFDPYSGGWLARVTYVGHFEKGDGNIAIAALLTGTQWRIVNFNLNSPLLYDNPADYRQKVEIYVTHSDSVIPGSHVKIIARSSNDKVLVKDAQVLYVRWKISAANVQEGFVTLALSKEEEALVNGAGELSAKIIK